MKKADYLWIPGTEINDKNRERVFAWFEHDIMENIIDIDADIIKLCSLFIRLYKYYTDENKEAVDKILENTKKSINLIKESIIKLEKIINKELLIDE